MQNFASQPKKTWSNITEAVMMIGRLYFLKKSLLNNIRLLVYNMMHLKIPVERRIGPVRGMRLLLTVV